VDDEEPPFSFVLVEGTAQMTADDPDHLHWATRIGGRYMGAELAEACGRRNIVPGDLLGRHPHEKIVTRTRRSPTEAAAPRGRWIMIRYVSDHGKKGHRVGERLPTKDLAARLRETLARPLDVWREVYESFSPVDVETGERRPRVPPTGVDLRQAAVLVPILLEPEGARLVYTVRRDHLPDHAGQISFPGGSMEAGDGSLLETALREAEEEIDLSPDLVEVIGELEEMYIPPSNFRVSPFVGLLPPEAELVMAPDEVEAIFTVALDELMSPETFRKIPWTRDGRDYMVPVFAVEDSSTRRNIWGATAAITASLLVRLGWKGYRAVEAES
jgi:8-oxo-dGTP pyrophosphatase MutT (NUDIX family)